MADNVKELKYLSIDDNLTECMLHKHDNKRLIKQILTL